MRSTCCLRAISVTMCTKTLGGGVVGDSEELVEAVVRPGLVLQLLLDDEHDPAALLLALPQEVGALEVTGEADDGQAGELGGHRDSADWQNGHGNADAGAGRDRQAPGWSPHRGTGP